MSEKYKFADSEGVYFVTATLVDWIDLFTKPIHQDILLDALRFAINNKGLSLHAWVIMSSHVHAIISAEDGYSLSAILRDWKKHTNKAIINELQTGNDSRSQYILDHFQKAAKLLKRVSDYKVWQDGNHPVQVDFTEYFEQKLEYIHWNPVKAGLVNEPEHYRLSSAIDYAGGKGLLPVEMWNETEG